MNNLAKYNPNGLLDSVFDEFIDGFFDSFGTNPRKFDVRRRGNQAPSVKQREDENSYKLSFAAPGVSKSDFNISLMNNTLTLAYEKASSETDFFKFSSFTRTWTVPDGTTAGDVHADYIDGVLTVTIGKVKAIDVEATTIEVK